MSKIIKITNHSMTDEQIVGLKGWEVVELPEEIQGRLAQCGPDAARLIRLATDVIEFAQSEGANFIFGPAGSPAFCDIFSNLCRDAQIVIVFSHSVRESIETVKEDGTVVKTNVFKHVSFINLPEMEGKDEIVERKFNDKQGNRDRECRYCIIYKGKAYSPKDKVLEGVVKFVSLGYTKEGKWSNTDWLVKTRGGQNW
jgi:hypothetical protein